MLPASIPRPPSLPRRFAANAIPHLRGHTLIAITSEMGYRASSFEAILQSRGHVYAGYAMTTSRGAGMATMLRLSSPPVWSKILANKTSLLYLRQALAPCPPLPAGWSGRWSAKKSVYYYVKGSTTTWNRPADHPRSAPAPWQPYWSMAKQTYFCEPIIPRLSSYVAA